MSRIILKTSNEIIGFYEGKNRIRPIFGRITPEDFYSKFSGREPVLAGHLAEDDDYKPDVDEEPEWF